MDYKRTVSYGAWESPISSELVSRGSIGIGQAVIDGPDVYWLEMRPAEGGRYVLVRRDETGLSRDITPVGYNVRTRVHEYGGGAYVVDSGTVYFSNFSDQRVYRQTIGSDPEPLTAEGPYRYADAIVDHVRKRLVCVREDHTGSDQNAVNSLVGIDTENGAITELVAGNDFYSTPRLSPDGTRMAWLTWDHPDMPWDGTELWIADVDDDGSVEKPQKVAGGRDESVFQPEWSPDGVLYFVSDRTGWWNIYRYRDNDVEPLCEKSAEFGVPQWLFKMTTYTFESARSIICTYREKGEDRLARLDIEAGELAAIDVPYTNISNVIGSSGKVVFHAGSPSEPVSLVLLDTVESNEPTVLRRATDVTVDPECLSEPEHIEFPTENGLTAHAFFYLPKNGGFVGPDTELPPLIVKTHGGPTASTSTSLSLSIQYWTSRGFAVVDVDYGGSTGYGREYRERLKGRWGIVDVDDCVNAARFLVARKLVDGNRMAITGGSAGGYTTLCALAFRDVFTAGASYYGVSDPSALAEDTHKFESRYLDSLIGPYPERRDMYDERAPIYHTDGFSCPLIVFQGMEDAIVPPNQAERIVSALKHKGIPVAYVPFEGEQHGFRRSENIKRALDAELYFYAKVFGFDLAEPVEPVDIDNL